MWGVASPATHGGACSEPMEAPGERGDSQGSVSPRHPPPKPPAYLLGEFHLYLLPDFLALLIRPPGENVPVLQLLLAGPVPQSHGQQLLLAFPRQSSWGSRGGGAAQTVLGVRAACPCSPHLPGERVWTERGALSACGDFQGNSGDRAGNGAISHLYGGGSVTWPSLQGQCWATPVAPAG